MGLDERGEKGRFHSLIRGMTNLEGTGKMGQVKIAIDFSVLRLIRHRIIDTIDDSMLKCGFWVCCLVAFWGSFRISELLPRKERNPDLTASLLWSDIADIGDDAVAIRIRKPKAMKGVETVCLFKCSSKNLCPIRALRHYREKLSAKGVFESGLPTFSLGEGKCLSGTKFAGVLKTISQLEPGLHIDCRSFRSGIPSLLERHPDLASDNHIKCWGRWRSDSYKFYMRSDLTQKRWLFKQIESALKLEI